MKFLAANSQGQTPKRKEDAFVNGKEFPNDQ
jgi:hypothetical protein